jgi:hypothetical protein
MAAKPIEREPEFPMERKPIQVLVGKMLMDPTFVERLAASREEVRGALREIDIDATEEMLDAIEELLHQREPIQSAMMALGADKSCH